MKVYRYENSTSLWFGRLGYVQTLVDPDLGRVFLLTLGLHFVAVSKRGVCAGSVISLLRGD